MNEHTVGRDRRKTRVIIQVRVQEKEELLWTEKNP